MYFFVASWKYIFFGPCKGTHPRPFGVANSSNIAFEVPLAFNETISNVGGGGGGVGVNKVYYGN